SGPRENVGHTQEVGLKEHKKHPDPPDNPPKKKIDFAGVKNPNKTKKQAKKFTPKNNKINNLILNPKNPRNT
ncbi:hypothetical protein, partial [Pseudomonas sp. CCC4.4]|uniref:hypothetical protein n=1 Tax=Pseudomonas sp. CCC4.4 TaxID=3048612 RepID=UPI002B23309D